MRQLFILLAIAVISCTGNNNKQDELDKKEKELAVKEKELNKRKDSLQDATKMVSNNQKPMDNPPTSGSLTDPSKYIGQWVGQGEDMIDIAYSNGQYQITLDYNNPDKMVNTIIKAREDKGSLLVDPGIYYGYNGMSTMTLSGTNKLVLKSGKNSYSYEREK